MLYEGAAPRPRRHIQKPTPSLGRWVPYATPRSSDAAASPLRLPGRRRARLLAEARPGDPRGRAPVGVHALLRPRRALAVPRELHHPADRASADWRAPGGARRGGAGRGGEEGGRRGGAQPDGGGGGEDARRGCEDAQAPGGEAALRDGAAAPSALRGRGGFVQATRAAGRR